MNPSAAAADLASVAKSFQFQGTFLEAGFSGYGHIHDTYAAWFQVGRGQRHRYLLQRINHEVFRDPEALMRNIERVTTHLHKRIAAQGGDPARETLTLIPTVDGGTFYRDPTADYWRAYIFIEGARTYEVAESPDQVYQAARAFGDFQKHLADFPAEALHETIPDFHHTPKRFEALLASLRRDVANRAWTAREEIAFVEQRAEQMSVLVDLLAEGKVPARVTHNDTKLNNVMIDDETGEAVCVIDLDTVMPGLVLYDFGDAVRAAANPAAEDECDLSKVVFDLPIFERLVAGYLDSAGEFLTVDEADYLAFSARLITLEIGMRFLTDYLDGDVYFKVARDGHNLDRCRTQFKMVRDMEACSEQMSCIVDRAWRCQQN
jgi:hypothetical protein